MDGTTKAIRVEDRDAFDRSTLDLIILQQGPSKDPDGSVFRAMHAIAVVGRLPDASHEFSRDPPVPQENSPGHGSPKIGEYTTP